MSFALTEGLSYSYREKGFVILHPQGPRAYALVHFLKPMHIWVMGEMQRFDAGAFAFFQHGMQQYYYPQTVDMLETWCHFTCDDLPQRLEALALPVQTPFYVREHSLAPALFVDMLDSWHAAEPQTIQEKKFNALLMVLSADRVEAQVISTGREALKQIRARIRREMEHNWTLAEMAQQVRFSVPHFCKLYVEQFGVSPIRDLNHMRMEQARYLLRTTTDSVEAIAGQLHYDSTTGFILRFRAQEGVTPHQYRLRCRGRRT